MEGIHMTKKKRRRLLQKRKHKTNCNIETNCNKYRGTRNTRTKNEKYEAASAILCRRTEG